jgi:hypothetical protein
VHREFREANAYPAGGPWIRGIRAYFVAQFLAEEVSSGNLRIGMEVQRIKRSDRVSVDRDAETPPQEMTEASTKLSLKFSYNRGDAAVV